MPLRPLTPFRIFCAGVALFAVAIALQLALLPSQPTRAAVAGSTWSTPELIEEAFKNGRITAEQRLVYLAYAVYEPASLPAEYRGTQGWSATHVIPELERGMQAAATGATRSAQATAELLRMRRLAQTVCDKPDGASVRETVNFRIVYDQIDAGLTIDEYADALETSYATLVTSYGYPKPPFLAANTFQKYPVQIASASLNGSTVYGYVAPTGGSYAGAIGDNPNTAAVETDAYASCMVVNKDLSFVGGNLLKKQNALKVTMAHEFWHSIQIGLGNPTTGQSFTAWAESIPPYIENEVFPGVDDPYQYLWPRFRECWSNYPVDQPAGSNSQYSNLLIYRYVAERLGGVNTPGGGEDVIQNWMASLAAGQREVPAYATAVAAKSSAMGQSLRLNDFFHNYAISVRFMKKCQSGDVYCFGEADKILAYVQANPPSTPIADVGTATAGQAYTGSIKDTYAIDWVGLPTSGSYSVTLAPSSGTGELRASIVADLGTSLSVTPLTSALAAGQSAVANYTVPSGATNVVLVITNQATPDPTYATCATTAYQVGVGATQELTPTATPTGSAVATATPTSTPVPSGTPVTTSNKLFIPIGFRASSDW